MRALVTAFDPFGGESINASREAVLLLPARLGTLDIATAILPTSYSRSLPALHAAIAQTRPDLVLCTGQADERCVLSVEHVAINFEDARIADNDGALPQGRPVIDGAPAAYFATLPVKAAVAALLAEGLHAEVSNSAGTFVCNHVFYGLMHFVASSERRLRAGFLHVPRLRGPELPTDAQPAMTPADIVRGIRIVLEIAAVRGA